MGLGLTSGSICERNLFGFVADSSRYFTRTSDTDFDNMTAVTVICFVNTYIGTGTHYVNPINLHYDTTNDTGFYTYGQIGSISSFNMSFADGSGGLTASTTSGANADAHKFGSKASSFKGTPFGMWVGRFNADADPEQMVAVIHRQGISFTETDNNVANLGAVGTNTTLRINNGIVNGTNIATIHKVSMWKSALSDGDILKLGGLTGSSIADSTTYNGDFRMATRFQSYSDLGVSEPDHEWDFTIVSPGTAAAIADTGGTGGKALTAEADPEIGKFIQY